MSKLNTTGKTNKKSRGKRGRMHGQFLAELRARIVSGEFLPGERLPTRPVLIKRYSISGIALQQAVDRLEREGFLSATPRLGTFVSQHPPHLAHYGLVFSKMPDGHNQWNFSRFWTALAQEAEKTSRQESGRTIKAYVGVTGHADNEQTRQLIADIKTRRLAGLILTDPYTLSTILPELNIPVVCFMRRPDLPNVYTIQLDQGRVLQRCIDHLATQGKKRVGLITSDSTTPLTIQHFEKLASDNNMQTSPGWTHGVNLHYPRWAYNIISAMMQAPPDSRPDSLIITDDHLVEPATHGLSAHGQEMLRQTAVVGYANLGHELPLATPVRRIGYVTSQLLDLAVQKIDKVNKGQRVARVIKVDPLFDFEADHAHLPLEGDAHLVR